jgi:long-chain acyl-CoA synthetase
VAAVTQAIKEHGLKARLLKTEIPSKVLVVADEWSPDSGLVTAAMKIRRKNITDHYKRDINRLYGISSDNGTIPGKST